MAKAVGENIPGCCYNEEVRAKLKQHIEQAVRRRGTCREIDWDGLWHKLESAARAYAWNAELVSNEAYSPGDTIKGLMECAELITALLRKLNNRALFNWNFISNSTEPWSRSIKGETLRFGYLIEPLTELRAKAAVDAEGLQKFAVGQKLRAYRQDDCVAEFKEGLLEIGQDLFGPQVGRNDGPLITFLQLALQPVLGDATPDPDALRTFARRHTQT